MEYLGSGALWLSDAIMDARLGGVVWLGRNFLNALLTWHSTLGHRISLLNDPIFGSAGKNLKPPSTT